MELLIYLQHSPGAWIAVLFLFGLIVGSFLNVVVHRLPLMLERDWRAECAQLLATPCPDTLDESFGLVRPRSRCPQCKAGVRAWHNIPVLSYLWLGGRCASCRARIPLRYPLIELAGGLLAAAAAWRFGFGWPALMAAVLSWSLLTLAAIDFDTQLLPDAITLPVLWLGLLCNLVPLFTSPRAAVLGAAAGYLILWLVYHCFRLLTGKEGMGYGDFKLLAMLGAWMGWQALPLVIILSSLVGAVVGITLIVLGGRDRSVPIPFGPYLAAAGWIALMWGEALTRAYVDWALPA
ncbi:MAG: prepilin peptidase [Gammaproteobacteria bacterium]|nr:prepilin peptidase [Gammaproteobacteria bacterium]